MVSLFCIKSDDIFASAASFRNSSHGQVIGIYIVKPVSGYVIYTSLPLNLNKVGSLTAWLLPFLNILSCFVTGRHN